MDTYEKLLTEFADELIIDDIATLPNGVKGYYTTEANSNLILLNKNIKTVKEKACVFTEELGHHYTTVGDITDQSRVENRKQELKARRWAVRKLIRVEKFIDAFNAGVRNRHELAQFLEVTEEFIDMSINHFKNIYGHSYTIGNYTIFFSPLWVYKSLE
ncbi:ImmA/IrrE family metallo-endopeptidase [Geosporobacter ferrireducens]|uniref:ImmA/IrrE family metallo-endopeptidase n=1 Tax=Geosporobacter ferrireducens TaxID=1424294 RepID=UPI00139BB74D|nr:ImmA/IrrE family metallo-endopeptidase [Geosporobacter ferrireducens]MTI56120.1 ImmA/IrrE family metallo-endopeptidase [Geosporobacter ferrireducens]